MRLVSIDAGNGWGYDAKIAQAQGMVSVQVDCPLYVALLLMQARARSTDLSLAYIASAVIAGHIRFDN